MPKVTDKQYQLPDFLIEKMNLACERVSARKLDGIFIVDGDEGFGKTGISLELAYYIAWKTGRTFTLDNVFFDPKEVTQFINSTKKQVIVWDEAALGGLASNWQSRVQQLLIQTLMTCRSRQHIIFFNCPKFYRLNMYFILERPIGLIHVYSEDRLNAGLCAFYKQEWLESMIGCWNTQKKKPYKIFCNKMLRGNFVDAFNPKNFLNGNMIINEEEYDKKKEHYTEKILSQYSNDRFNEKLLKLQYLVYTFKGALKKELAEHFQVSPQTMAEWGKIPSKYPEIFKEND